MGRILSIVHIIIGFLLFCFGIADLVVAYFFTGYGAYGIWIGIWVSTVFATCQRASYRVYIYISSWIKFARSVSDIQCKVIYTDAFMSSDASKFVSTDLH